MAISLAFAFCHLSPPSSLASLIFFFFGSLLSLDCCVSLRRVSSHSFTEGLDLVKEAIDRAGYKDRIKLALNVSATDFCIGKKYDLDFKSPNRFGQNFKTGKDMIEMYTQLCTDYPIASIEEPFDKDDWEHTKLFSGLGICQVVGDELLMSNPKRIERTIHEFTCNALLLKVNHIGTVPEAIEAVKLAKAADWGVVVYHRCGETEDASFAVESKLWVLACFSFIVKAQRRARIHKVRLEKGALKAAEELEKYDPFKDPNVTGDPYETLFVARFNYETTELQLR